MENRQLLAPVARAWPVQLALAMIVALLAGMVGVDLVIARKVAARTAHIVENTQRSVELLEDLHTETFRISDADLSSREVASIADRMDAIAKDYDPIADNIGERAGWNVLQVTLHHLRDLVAAGNEREVSALSNQIDEQIERLIVINREAAHASADAIRATHRNAIIADGTVGALVLLLCGGVAWVLRRVLARQRALFAAHIALLDERNRELDLFAAKAAHDLRSPLSPIRGYADILASGRESVAEVQQMASRIRTAVDKMARVVDDMLELSRAGRPLPGRASVREVTDEVLEELAAELRGVDMRIDVTERAVACAPGVLQQILRNLVHNAVKFRDRERPLRISVTARALPAHEGCADRVELQVTDNGVGMDEDLANHAFEPYHRGRTDREVPGHGLGLAIVDRATTALGGTISLRAAPDQGCAFTITLPATDERG